jgi:phosphoglycerate dehydrogenase-like enzyme
MGTDLKLIHFRTSGVDRAVGYGLPAGIPVSNSPGLSAPCNAEHAIAMLLMLSRRMREIDAAQTRHDWIRRDVAKRMVCMHGLTMVVIGFGAIGQEMCIKAKGLGMKVILVSRDSKTGPTVDEVVGRDKLIEALAKADVVSMCTTLTAETHYMLGCNELAAMKPTAFLLNVARNDLVDEQALIDALTEKRIAGAGLDVFNPEPLEENHAFWDLDNCIVSPHVSGNGYDSEPLTTEILTDVLNSYLAGETPKTVLDAERLTPIET